VRLTHVAAIIALLGLLAFTLIVGGFVAARHKLWRAITKTETELRTLGPVVEETRADPPALPFSDVCEVGSTKVPRGNFVQVKYQAGMCLLRTVDWTAMTVHDSPVEVFDGVTIAVRVADNGRPPLGWWEAMRTPSSELGRRLVLAVVDVGSSRIMRVIRTPTRTIGIATPVKNQQKRDVFIEIDGGTRMLVWQFVPGRRPLDEEFLINWALQVQY
jgi:hypothetical protein